METTKLLRLDSVEYRPHPDDADGEPDGYPNFLVRGVYLTTGAAFTREVGMELDGRDADQTHVDGFDLDDADCDRCDLDEELYNGIFESEAYRTVARAYHGLDGE